MDNEEELETNNVLELDEDLRFEEELAKKVAIKAQGKKKKEAVARYYLDPDELEANLREYVIMRAINPDHIMSKKLALNIVLIVKEYAEGGQFRSYYNGWKEDMKSRAHEHICRYAHGYKIDYVKSTEFFLRWLFRKKQFALQKWLNDRGVSYTKFYKGLLDVIIKTPNGKEKSKMGKKIFVSDLTKLNNPEIYKEHFDPSLKKEPIDGIVFDEDKFKDEIFSNNPQNFYDDFVDQVKRNPFNYLTKYAYNAFIAVIKEEKAVSDNSQSYEDKMKYASDSFDEDTHGFEDRYTQIDEDKFDWETSFIE